MKYTYKSRFYKGTVMVLAYGGYRARRELKRKVGARRAKQFLKSIDKLWEDMSKQHERNIIKLEQC